MNIEQLFDYEDLDVIDTLFVQYNYITFKQSFYGLPEGTKLAWFAVNFATNEYSFAYKSDDEPNQWFNGKIQVTFGTPA